MLIIGICTRPSRGYQGHYPDFQKALFIRCQKRAGEAAQLTPAAGHLHLAHMWDGDDGRPHVAIPYRARHAQPPRPTPQGPHLDAVAGGQPADTAPLCLNALHPGGEEKRLAKMQNKIFSFSTVVAICVSILAVWPSQLWPIASRHPKEDHLTSQKASRSTWATRVAHSSTDVSRRWSTVSGTMPPFCESRMARESPTPPTVTVHPSITTTVAVVPEVSPAMGHR